MTTKTAKLNIFTEAYPLPVHISVRVTTPTGQITSYERDAVLQQRQSLYTAQFQFSTAGRYTWIFEITAQANRNTRYFKQEGSFSLTTSDGGSDGVVVTDTDDPIAVTGGSSPSDNTVQPSVGASTPITGKPRFEPKPEGNASMLVPVGIVVLGIGALYLANRADKDR